MSIFFTAQAGYVIRGIPALVDPTYFKNYTLTFDENGEPVAAASMINPSDGRHSIVIVQANNSTAYIFPVTFDPENLEIEVRDFHYLNDDGKDQYILCGSRGTRANARAFVARIDGTFSLMEYFEYPEASTFYSISVHADPLSSFSILGFFACGIKDHDGVIVSINKYTLQLTSLYKNINWEYHKIIRKQNAISDSSHFVVSGRDPDCTQIGYTLFDPVFTTVNNYFWAQNTEPASLCVVSDFVTENKVVLASSFRDIVSLTPVNIAAPLSSGSAYHFSMGLSDKFCVQDIETIEAGSNIHISVAGYAAQDLLLSQHHAWYGHVTGLSGSSIMNNNNYYRLRNQYEHYKVRHNDGRPYTGGYFQGNNAKSVLFATPMVVSDCDNFYSCSNIEMPYIPDRIPVPFDHISVSDGDFFQSNEYLMLYDECQPFKEAPAPELVMSFETESEINIYYDHITVKDTPTNTYYQIYTVTGQLLHSGTTNPDVSTAQLSKGIYILRLDNGKAFKFVK